MPPRLVFGGQACCCKAAEMSAGRSPAERAPWARNRSAQAARVDARATPTATGQQVAGWSRPSSRYSRVSRGQRTPRSVSAWPQLDDDAQQFTAFWSRPETPHTPSTATGNAGCLRAPPTRGGGTPGQPAPQVGSAYIPSRTGRSSATRTRPDAQRRKTRPPAAESVFRELVRASDSAMGGMGQPQGPEAVKCAVHEATAPRRATNDHATARQADESPPRLPPALEGGSGLRRLLPRAAGAELLRPCRRLALATAQLQDERVRENKAQRVEMERSTRQWRAVAQASSLRSNAAKKRRDHQHAPNFGQASRVLGLAQARRARQAEEERERLESELLRRIRGHWALRAQALESAIKAPLAGSGSGEQRTIATPVRPANPESGQSQDSEPNLPIQRPHVAAFAQGRQLDWSAAEDSDDEFVFDLPSPTSRERIHRRVRKPPAPAIVAGFEDMLMDDVKATARSRNCSSRLPDPHSDSAQADATPIAPTTPIVPANRHPTALDKPSLRLEPVSPGRSNAPSTRPATAVQEVAAAAASHRLRLAERLVPLAEYRSLTPALSARVSLRVRLPSATSSRPASSGDVSSAHHGQTSAASKHAAWGTQPHRKSSLATPSTELADLQPGGLGVSPWVDAAEGPHEHLVSAASQRLTPSRGARPLRKKAPPQPVARPHWSAEPSLADPASRAIREAVEAEARRVVLTRLGGGHASTTRQRINPAAMQARIDAIESLKGPFGSAKQARGAVLSSVVTVDAELPDRDASLPRYAGATSPGVGRRRWASPSHAIGSGTLVRGSLPEDSPLRQGASEAPRARESPHNEEGTGANAVWEQRAKSKGRAGQAPPLSPVTPDGLAGRSRSPSVIIDSQRGNATAADAAPDDARRHALKGNGLAEGFGPKSALNLEDLYLPKPPPHQRPQRTKKEARVAAPCPRIKAPPSRKCLQKRAAAPLARLEFQLVSTELASNSRTRLTPPSQAKVS